MELKHLPDPDIGDPVLNVKEMIQDQYFNI